MTGKSATDSIRLGMLTPSSNTVLEPVTAAMLRDLPDVTAHFGRFRVLKIALDSTALGQFTNEPMLEAARLLADAQVNAICWNGTSSGWLGFEADKELCAEITAETGVASCTSVLALNEVLTLTGARKIAFVTPYLPDVQQKIIANYEASGWNVVAERHLGDAGNYSFATYDEATVAGLCREVAEAKPDAICVFCTNFRGGPIAAQIEAETGIPVYDTVATALWKSLRVAGGDPARVTGWGRIFSVAA